MKKLLFLTLFLSLCFIKSQAQNFFYEQGEYLTGEINVVPNQYGVFNFVSVVDTASLHADGLILVNISVAATATDETTGDEVADFYLSNGYYTGIAPQPYADLTGVNSITEYNIDLPYFNFHGYDVNFQFTATYEDSAGNLINDIVADEVTL